MGYTTEFDGKFNFNRPLDGLLYLKLTEFAKQRHEGPSYPNLSYYCQWVPTEDRLSLEWDGGEKFYDYEKWLVYLIENFIKPADYVLNGKVKWQGEDMDDRGTLEVNNNVVVSRKFTEPSSNVISVWRFEDAPEEYKQLSTNGGDEDWVAFIPDGFDMPEHILWMQDGGPFGCAGVQEVKVLGGSIRIGSHS